jgi:hypothetical protein
MRSGAKKTFYYQADANALGGFIETPLQKIIPSQSSVSLPQVGGYAATRTEAFNFEEIVSCRSAYTRVAGREHAKDGPWSILVASVVEGLNILEIVTAERIVAQISVHYPNDGRLPRFSLAGSHFEGLRIAGRNASPHISPTLLDIGRLADTTQSGVEFGTFQKTGREQAAKLLSSIPGGPSDGPYEWLFNRFGWMDPGVANGQSNDPPAEKDGFALCSLVDGVDPEIPGQSFGHVIQIPDFGRIFLGELLVSPRSIRIAMIRAELGCNTTGSATGGGGGVGGHLLPP